MCSVAPHSDCWQLAQELWSSVGCCLLCFSSDAPHSPKLSTRHEQHRVISSYVLKILKKKTTQFFCFLVRKTTWWKKKSAVYFPRRDALYKLNLCITCQSPGLWAGSCLPWIFILSKVNLLKLWLWAIWEWIKKEISAEDRQFRKRWETEYLKTSPRVSFAIRDLNLMVCHGTRRRGLSRFYETEKKSPRERKICYATRLLCFPVCRTANYTDAIRIMIMHNVAKALHVRTVCWKAKCEVKTLLSLHLVSLQQMRTPSRLSPQGWAIHFLNFLHIHLQLMWGACQSTDRKCWMNYISEREFSPFIPCMMPQLLPCTETTWKHLLVGTNVLCDKDQGIFSWVQLQKTRHPPSRSSRINELALKEKVWGKKKGGANRSR